MYKALWLRFALKSNRTVCVQITNIIRKSTITYVIHRLAYERFVCEKAYFPFVFFARVRARIHCIFLHSPFHGRYILANINSMWVCLWAGASAPPHCSRLIMSKFSGNSNSKMQKIHMESNVHLKSINSIVRFSLFFWDGGVEKEVFIILAITGIIFSIQIDWNLFISVE